MILLPEWYGDVAGGLATPTAGKITILLPFDVVEVAIAIDHHRLSSSIPDGGCMCEPCSDSMVDVAHLTPFADVHLCLLEAGVVGVGPMLCLVLHGAPGVVAAYKGEKLWVVVGITLQIIVDLHGPPLSQQCGMVVITITCTISSISVTITITTIISTIITIISTISIITTIITPIIRIRVVRSITIL